MSALDPYEDLVIPDPIDDPTVAMLPGNAWATGNTGPMRMLPVAGPPSQQRATLSATPAYADVAALLDGTMPEPPRPAVLYRSDGHALFYAGQVSLIFGDPESGKTWLCLAAAAEALTHGKRALVVDMDHNGPHSTVARLVLLGAPAGALRDPARFRYIEPEDGIELIAVVGDSRMWQPDVVVLDSLGEVVPLFGGSSNSPDDFTRVHALVMKPLAMAGAAVLCVDHLAKGSESRAQGSTGTAAKRRVIGGVSLRVTVRDAFTPGKGGAAHLTVSKDRHGGLREHCPTGDREPLAGTFVMTVEDGETHWQVRAPQGDERNPAEAADPADVDALKVLDPPPHSVRDVAERMTWNWKRAGDALRDFRALPDVLPVADTGVQQHGNTLGNTCTACGEPLDPWLADQGLTHANCEMTA